MSFIYITKQGAVLKRSGRRFIVEKDHKKLLDVPAIHVKGILIFGNVQFTTQAVKLMFSEGIEMAMFTLRGKLLGQLTAPCTKNISLREAQYARKSDPEFTLPLAKTIVRAKLGNAVSVLRSFAHNHSETDLADECSRIDGFISQTDSPPNLPSLF